LHDMGGKGTAPPCASSPRLVAAELHVAPRAVAPDQHSRSPCPALQVAGHGLQGARHVVEQRCRQVGPFALQGVAQEGVCVCAVGRGCACVEPRQCRAKALCIPLRRLQLRSLFGEGELGGVAGQCE
jgi:hypothetical protein